MSDIKRVEIAGQVRRETPKALLFFDGTVEDWLPKFDWNGQLQLEEKLDGHRRVVALVMPEALARKKGFFVDGSKSGDLFE